MVFKCVLKHSKSATEGRAGLPWRFNTGATVDGRNPAPSKTPRNDDPSVNTNAQWFQPWFPSGAEFCPPTGGVCLLEHCYLSDKQATHGVTFQVISCIHGISKACLSSSASSASITQASHSRAAGRGMAAIGRRDLAVVVQTVLVPQNQWDPIFGVFGAPPI